MPDLNARIDADRLDWLGEPGYAKSRMDDVLTLMRGREIREAIDAAITAALEQAEGPK